MRESLYRTYLGVKEETWELVALVLAFALGVIVGLVAG